MPSAPLSWPRPISALTTPPNRYHHRHHADDAMLDVFESKAPLLSGTPPSASKLSSPSSRPTWRRRVRLAVVGCAVLLTTSAAWRSWRRASDVDAAGWSWSAADASLPIELPDRPPFDARRAEELNATLGFERIFVLNLPERRNKRDELALMASLTDLKLSYPPGMTELGSEIDATGVPLHNLPAGQLGSWRSHANAWRTMLEEGVSTALILEDDADWDVDVRRSLARARRPFGALLSAVRRDGVRREPTPSEPWHSPSDWDVLYFGSCAEEPFGESKDGGPAVLHADRPIDPEHPPFVTFHDDSVPNRDDTQPLIQDFYRAYGVPQPEADDDDDDDDDDDGGDDAGGGDRGDRRAASRKRRVRFVMRANFPVCTLAYAVSRRGARRLLYHTTRYLEHPLDVTMATLSQRGDVESYELWPPSMAQWKVAAALQLNSDVLIEDFAGERYELPRGDDYNPHLDPSVGNGHGIQLRRSTRRSMRAMITGSAE